ncbi:hypothetical protein [Shewanella sp.]|uniref:hypothetical protein n=1 Tax=Shewanella sp. TaxID=50422 RepID=UPI001EC89F04|nr:hypothetical protein [Shewanella sp.]NRB25798.1 hypothetical protein [Shewanella sp.]
MNKALDSYIKRRRKWINSIPATTKSLANEIDGNLVKKLRENGFELVPYCMGDTKNLVDKSESYLEKKDEHFTYCISIMFDKYDRAAFQVNLLKRESERLHNIVDSSNLVASNNQFVYFWGKPWWIPSAFWSEKSSSNLISKICSYSTQILDFFETGKRGSQLSREIIGSLQKN